MDAQKAKQFNIKSTLNLSERSPLLKQADKTNNMYARMPTIFAKNKDIDGDSIMKVNFDETSLSEASKHIASIEQLVQEGGSAAY